MGVPSSGSEVGFSAPERMVAFEREEDWEFGRDVDALKVALANTLKSWVSTNDKVRGCDDVGFCHGRAVTVGRGR